MVVGLLGRNNSSQVVARARVASVLGTTAQWSITPPELACQLQVSLLKKKSANSSSKETR